MSVRKRYRWCKETQQLVEILPAERCAAPTVYSDTIDATISDADGKVYTSRSKMRAGAAAAGCVEVSKADLGRERVRGDFSHGRDAFRESLDKVEKAWHDLRENRVPRRECPEYADVVRRVREI